jgi:putative PIN family toxin of toxin-antitoxin system
LKVVLDSSTWISALNFGGVPRRAAEEAALRDRIAVCRHIESEIYRALTGKFGWSNADVVRRLAQEWIDAIWVETTGSIAGVCRDPADDAIIECAVLADAVLIVTGDHDLLELNQYGRVRILTARQYLEYAEAAGV